MSTESIARPEKAERQHPGLPLWLEALPELVRRQLRAGHRPERIEQQFRQLFTAYLSTIVNAWTAVLSGRAREAWVHGEVDSAEPPWMKDPCGLESLAEIRADVAAIREQLAGMVAPKRPRGRKARRSPK